jgi:uncharacterized peroxidase-related enzyme
MAPASTASPAWLTVPPAGGLPGRVATGIGPVADKVGLVPDVARLLAASPDHVTGWWGYFGELMRGPSGVSTTQREMIAVLSSAEARCLYSQAAHAAALRLRTKDPVLADRLAVSYRHAGLAPQDRLMLDLAVKLTPPGVRGKRRGPAVGRRVHRCRHLAHRGSHRDLQLQRAARRRHRAVPQRRVPRTRPNRR